MSRGAKKKRHAQPGLSLVSVVGSLMGFLIAFFTAEVALALQPHYWHWVAAAGGAAVGYVFGYGWYRWRGDIV